MFGGYTLVYAAVAKGGVFATEPWASWFADAYVGGPLSNQQAAQEAGPGFTPLSPNFPKPLPSRPRTVKQAVVPGFPSLSPSFP